MLAGPQGDAPFRALDHARIDDPFQEVIDELVADLAPASLWEVRLGLEKALHFGLCLETARGVPLQAFLNDRGERFIAHQDIAVSGTLFILEAHGRGGERPVAVHDPRPHPILGLLGILGALMGRNRGQQMLDELAVAILAELDAGAFQHAARLSNGRTKRQMRIEPTRKAADIVDQDTDVVFAVGPQIGEQLLHAGPLDQRTGDGLVLEHLLDPVAFHPGILFAPGGLTFRALAFLDLGDG